MGILTSIIPGFRTLRTPVTAGMLWLSCLAIFALEHNVHFHVQHSLIATANAFLPDWVGIVVLPVVLGAAYLLGSVTVGLTDPLVRKVIACYRFILHFIVRHFDFQVLWWRPSEYIRRLARRSELVTVNARSLIYDCVISALTDAGATGTAAMLFPFGGILDKLQQFSVQLSQEAPTQFQEYDRLRAEAAFRMAVVPPLIIISVQAPLLGRGHGVIILSTVIASIVLISQSVSLSRQANEILASAARNGYLQIPEMKSVSAFLQDVDPRPTSDGAWMGAIIVGLHRRGFFEETQAMITEATELDQDYDVQALDSYLKSSDADIAAQFEREFRRNRGVEVWDFQGRGFRSSKSERARHQILSSSR